MACTSAFIHAIMLLLCVYLLSVVKADHPCSQLIASRPLQDSISPLLASEQDFDLQQLLLEGFRMNDVNTYNIRRFGFTSDGGTERCIIVRYDIMCNDTNEMCTNELFSNRCDFEGDVNITEWSFLWSSFDTLTYVGKILLKLAIFDLRVFGFELCDVYQEPVTVTFILNSSDLRIPMQPTCETICDVLLDFTTLLPGLSGEVDSSKTPEAIGYASYWNWKEENKVLAHEDALITIFSVLIVVATKFILLGFSYEILQAIRKHKVHSKTHEWYYHYWGAQILIVCTLSAIVYFELTKQRNKTALYIFLGSFGFDLLAFIFMLSIITKLCKTLVSGCSRAIISDLCGCKGSHICCCGLCKIDTEYQNINDSTSPSDVVVSVGSETQERNEIQEENERQEDIETEEGNEIEEENETHEGNKTQERSETPEENETPEGNHTLERNETQVQGGNETRERNGTQEENETQKENETQVKNTPGAINECVPPPLTLLFHCFPFCCCFRKLCYCFNIYWIWCFPIVYSSCYSNTCKCLLTCCACKCECCGYWWCSACGIPFCIPLSSEDNDDKPCNDTVCVKMFKCHKCVKVREKFSCDLENVGDWEKCGKHWYTCWTVLMNITSLFVFLAFVSYLSQALPAMVISYYLSPTASLIRLGFFEVVIVILLFEVAYVLFLMDKLTWLCYFNKKKEMPKEIEPEDDEYTGKKTKDINKKSKNKGKDKDSKNEKDTFISQYIKTTQEGKKTKKELIYDFCRCKNCYKLGCSQKKRLTCYSPLFKGSKLNPPCMVDCEPVPCCNEIKTCHFLYFLILFQILTMLFITILSAILLFFLLNVIIEQTSGSNNEFRDILAIVPTIALNMWLLFREGSLFEAWKNIASKANKNLDHDPMSMAEQGRVRHSSSSASFHHRSSVSLHSHSMTHH